MRRSKAITHFLYDTFSKEMKRVEESRCPLCGKPVTLVDFRDKLSACEFEISGLCQKCQDNYFVGGKHEQVGR